VSRAAARRRIRVASAIVACSLSAAAAAQQNLGFETIDATTGAPLGWTALRNSDGVAIATDEQVVVDGARSLRVERATPGGATRIVQRIAAATLRGGAARAARVRLTGALLAEGAATAALWLRIDGERGPLFLDSGGAGEHIATSASTAGYGERGRGWNRAVVELPLPADVEEVAVGVSVRGTGTAWFDALAVTVVSNDASPPAPAVVRYVDAALELLREHALLAPRVDWSALRAATLEHARGATTPADAHVAVRFAVRELGDRHSYLQSPAATRALAATAVSNARTGVPLAMPRSQRLDGGIAYLTIPGFAGGTSAAQVEFAENLNNLIQAADHPEACGWIVDLRDNSGGNLWPMLAGLGALVGEGELAASVYRDGRRVPIWHRDGQAGFGDYTQLRVRAPHRLRAAAPVAVLVDASTASSAEVLAVALRARPTTRLFGEPTRGLSAGNRTFVLGDGASLVLTVAATSDRAGQVVLGPVVPDEQIQRRGGADGAAALRAATDWLAGRGSCL
jgi:hypothetical protein